MLDRLSNWASLPSQVNVKLTVTPYIINSKRYFLSSSYHGKNRDTVPAHNLDHIRSASFEWDLEEERAQVVAVIQAPLPLEPYGLADPRELKVSMEGKGPCRVWGKPNGKVPVQSSGVLE